MRGVGAAWGIVGLALGLRLVLVALASREPARLYLEPDSSGYQSLAMSLLHHHRFSLASAPPFLPDHTRTPVYPTLLAAVYSVTGAEPVAGALVGALAAAATVAILVTRGTPLIGATPAMVAGAVVALDLTSAAYGTFLLTEAVFTLCLTGGLLALAQALASGRSRPLGQAGIWLGLAALTRPIGLYLPLLACGAFIVRCGTHWRRAVAGVVLLLSASAVVTVPWAIRNRLTGGTLSLSSIAPINLYYQRAGAVIADAAGTSREAAQRQLTDRLHAQVRREGLSEAEGERLMTRWATDIIRADAPRYVRLHLEGIARMLGPSPEPIFLLLGWLGPDRGPAPGREGLWRLLKALEALGLATLYAAAAVGAGRSIRAGRIWVVVPALLTLAYTAIVAGPEVYPRFRVPLMPAFAWLAGVGIGPWLGRIGRDAGGA